MQSKRMSLLESMANLVTAFILGYVVTFYLVPIIWGANTNMKQPIAFVLLLNVLSTLRHYIWRRLFSRWEVGR